MVVTELLRIGIVSDVDEVLLNSALMHWQILFEYGMRNGWENMPTYEEFCKKGGSTGAFGNYPGYHRINGNMRFDPEFNLSLSPIEGALDAIQQLQQSRLAPHVIRYLTTRPDEIAELTHNHLVQTGFPDVPVIARPSSVPVEQTSKWKIEILHQLLREVAPTLTTLVMIDDSLSLYNAILRLNNPQIRGILHAGPITPPHPDAKTWPQIVQELRKMSSHPAERARVRARF